jgi:DNA-binding response OmpR family regulator
MSEKIGKVMLVEDDPTMLTLLDTLLQIEGYEVVKIQRIQNAKQEILLEKPDILLMDVNLKEVDGKKLLEELRQEQGLMNTKIIMTSGMDFHDECLSQGANAFLLKPYMPDELVQLINQLLNS